MKLTLEQSDMKYYLESSDIINFEDNNIQKIATELVSGLKDEISIINKVYKFVRDKIHHSIDINGRVVTCKASEVLKYGEGICYAKSHLLAAILRFLEIPTGFCYQKLILGDDEKPWLVLHGLNAVYVKTIEKWIRIDARGNKDSIYAEFSLDKEKLAFPIRKSIREEDMLSIYSKPNKNVVESLSRNETIIELINDLPKETIL
mgnify:CR=1 FL=1